MRDRVDVGAACRDWWAREIMADSGAARALRARLRRAERPSEILAETAVHRLARTLDSRSPQQEPERIARVATVLAAVKATGPRLARGLGRAELSGLRFQRLLRTEEVDLGRAVRRVLPFVEHRCDVGALAADLFFWTEATRVRWCFDYFGTDAPDAVKQTQTEETGA